MTQTPDIFVYSHEWHLTRSGAFLDLVVQPLQRYARINHQAWSNDSSAAHSSASVLVFCQVLPPAEWLLHQNSRLVWIPMWDAIRDRPQAWWNQLPKSLRIVAFSKAVALCARRAGLSVYEVQYFKNPFDFTPAKWDGERTLFYWNRRGILSPEFLEQFCASLNIDRLLFRAD
ncbi:MAG: hypothetical protein ABI700_10110, partial [Chloroflexota bacterium]